MQSPWQEVELAVDLELAVENPYTDAEVELICCDADGRSLIRPAFWDGGSTWRARVALTHPGRWTSEWSVRVEGRREQAPAPDIDVQGLDPTATNVFVRHGFWRVDRDLGQVFHADGTLSFVTADTAWAMPWRATTQDVLSYARDRAAKGFNAVLLMSMQPDMGARGPRDRTQDEGFDVAFDDLADGTLRSLRPEYFQYLDGIVDILLEHGIVPVWSPLFHGFGWKGLSVIGPVADEADTVRYYRYLVARYGARPAIYLAGADGSGRLEQVEAGGKALQHADCYGQPIGLHYQPHSPADAHQDAEWLDFQWCQTGHEAEHLAERVAVMAARQPRRAVANGEPTYENSGFLGRATGWWQGHEAWSNLFAGSLMGVVYGAGSMWQWRLHADEPGHSPYFLAPGCGWREALDFEGSGYVGLMGEIVRSLPLEGAETDWTRAICGRGLSVSDSLLVLYRPQGGPVQVVSDDVPDHYRILDPRTGAGVATGTLGADRVIQDPGGDPRLYILTPEPH
ncbi:MAG: DUF4038 domain-containing protein [Actinomycetales bacterium]